MTTNTYIPLDKTTVTGSAVPSITFTGISGSYTDLVLVANWTITGGSSNMLVTFNGDSTSGLYSKTQIEGDGTSSLTGNSISVNNIGLESNLATSTTAPSISIINILNYSNNSIFKTVLARQTAWAGGAAGTSIRSATWRNNNAITSITITGGGTNIAVGSTFSLYGILAEGVSPTTKATGGAVYSDDVYYYHVFGASGTFTPTQSITADILAVAGGAGGGRSGGGGGAGGYLAFTSQSLTATGYTVTVGSGGAGNNTDGQTGTSGGDSQFGGLTLVKGGGGGGSYNANGASGASGGGGGSVESTTKTGGSATPSGQGNAGGNGFNGTLSTNRGGGGGGGAGAVGAVATSATGGNGGIGLATYSSWGIATGVGQNISGTYYLSGGGGGYGASVGGSGGFGGGGGKGVAGTANTGGGGGGSASDGTIGFSGGSGVVIVRYAK